VWSDGNGNLDDPTVSREHARIICGWGTWSLCDLDSRNGSFVNGRSVEPGTYAPLIDGSVICLGSTIAIFRTTPAADLADPGDAPFELRERREAILPWAQRFVLEARATVPGDVWSPLAAECLVNYDWPDDLHELREVVQALVTGSRPFPIDHSDLPEKITARWKVLRKAEPLRSNKVPEPALATIEAALMATQGFVRRAAHLLGIPRRRLYHLCMKHGIEIDRYRRPVEENAW
jgi:predicted component of type VI protein secretion system